MNLDTVKHFLPIPNLKIPGIDRYEKIDQMEEDPENQTSNTSNSDELHLNFRHFKTFPGVVKLVQFFVGSALMFTTKLPWFSVLVFIAFLMTSFWIVSYLLSLQNRWNLQCVSWLVLELSLTCVTTFLYIVATSLEFISVTDFHVYIPSLAGGYINSVAYGIGAVTLLSEWRHTNPEQSPPVPYARQDPLHTFYQMRE